MPSCLTVQVRGRPARVWVGGEVGAPALVLVHGGWAGAEMHWSPVWDRLAARHRVLAPELPGLGDLAEPALPSVAAYADWLVSVLDVLGVARAWWIGNSFGASVCASVAGRHPDRALGLALVNGFPMPATPPWLARLSRGRLARLVVGGVVRRIYREASLRRAFAEPSRMPPSLRAAMATWPAIVPRYVEILIAGDGPPPPRCTPLLVFGADDRLPGTQRRDAEVLSKRLPARLVRIEGAGHFPQVEQPEAFARAIEAWASSDVSLDRGAHS